MFYIWNLIFGLPLVRSLEVNFSWGTWQGYLTFHIWAIQSKVIGVTFKWVGELGQGSPIMKCNSGNPFVTLPTDYPGTQLIPSLFSVERNNPLVMKSSELWPTAVHQTFWTGQKQDLSDLWNCLLQSFFVKGSSRSDQLAKCADKACWIDTFCRMSSREDTMGHIYGLGECHIRIDYTFVLN